MKLVITIPTYNEKESIEDLCRAIFENNRDSGADIHVLVVDDNSPDGTSDIVARVAQENLKVHLLTRKENRGRGWAGIDGFREALKYEPDYVMEMDADFSHDPKYISNFLETIEKQQADIVIGSRYIEGGEDIDRGFVRRVVSTFARLYLRIILGIKQNDPTSGYRLFTRNMMEKLLPYLSAQDPFIVTEVLYHANRFGANIIEIPIHFMDREKGESKLGTKTLVKYLLKVLFLRMKKIKSVG